jgi:hypothetical protein
VGVETSSGRPANAVSAGDTRYLFLVGATKAGTSTLHLWLNQHPDIELSQPKELHYFCSCPAPHLKVATTFSMYLEHLFTDSPVTGESSPCYLYYPKVPWLLADHFPDCQILVSLRDPVERYWSHYLMNEVYRPTGLSPERLLEVCLERGRSDALSDLYGVGLYSEQLQRLLDVFGRKRVKTLFLEEIEADPTSAMGSVFDFLDLPGASVDTRERDKQYVEPRGSIGKLALRNPTVRKIGVRLIAPPLRRILRTRFLGVPKKPEMPANLRKRLSELYADDSRDLENLLGRQLPWAWRRT